MTNKNRIAKLRSAQLALALMAGLFAAGCTTIHKAAARSKPVGAGENVVLSPDANLKATVTFHESDGTVSYRVESRGQEVIAASPIGIETSRGDFRSGAKFVGGSREKVDETYTLPQGKVSTYHNRANELVLRLQKGSQELRVRFRVYDDGIAYSFAMPGSGEISFMGESSAVNLSGQNFTYYGQDHPNNYGYESMLGEIEGERMSIPVLAHSKDRNHWLFLAQAATYGHYINPHFDRSGSNFKFAYPLDQAAQGPVRSTLPFQSPWRLAMISPNDPGTIVESIMMENLNPPTDPRLLDPDGTVADWIKPGRVMWDFIAGDRNQPRTWVDAVAEMGWEYYMADAGFARQFGGEDGVREATKYAADKGIGIIGWAHSSAFDTQEKAINTTRRYAEMGLKGAKIDFFDHDTVSSPTNRRTDDYEDTQRSLIMRDWIFEEAIKNKFLLELHGNMIPTGERRRYPNLMTLEGIAGMEKRTPTIVNDLTIPYVRNVMGPASYTVIRFRKSPGSHAYQLAMPIVYEAGLMIYAERHRELLDWAGRELIKDIPSNWDETRFIEGAPGSHAIFARRKGDDWFIGGMTAQARTAEIGLNFLPGGKTYQLLLFRDDTHTEMKKETLEVKGGGRLSIPMLENGGFGAKLTPAR